MMQEIFLYVFVFTLGVFVTFSAWSLPYDKDRKRFVSDDTIYEQKRFNTGSLLMHSFT